jgi:hypothetical protein
VQTHELATLERERPLGNDEEEQSLYSNEVNYLEELFEEDLFPTMRYSFIVFLHTVFETRLRGFCEGMRRERKLKIGVTDLHGSAVEQARDYLTKLVDIPVASFPEWAHLRRFQSVRDCIVHHYGYLNGEDSRHNKLRQGATNLEGLHINADDRIILSRAFCEQHLSNIESFFNRLFAADSTK